LDFRRPPFSTTPMGLFRTVAYWEGWSFLLLLFISMPLKYALGQPMGVRIMGSVHGLLFLAYLATLLPLWGNLGTTRVFMALLVSVLPFGTFWLESKLSTPEWNQGQA